MAQPTSESPETQNAVVGASRIATAFFAVLCLVLSCFLGGCDAADTSTVAQPDARQAENSQTAVEASGGEASADEDAQAESPQADQPAENPAQVSNLGFRTNSKLQSHYEKHGIEMGFDSPESYVAAANQVISNPDALHKLEAEDGDDVYFLPATGEIVFVSQDGYIRTYFITDQAYYDRQ